MLSAAIGTLLQQWGSHEMAQARAALCDAMGRAEQALALLAKQQDEKGIAFKIHVMGLATLTMLAHEEIQHADRLAREGVRQWDP